MDFADQITALAARASKQLEHIQTEEATKNALVLPFINALGYNVFDPTEVVPEFTADVGIKKGEKVDYAIMREGRPIMLIECKQAGTDLNKKHASQLFRYFTVTEARIGVLTNGMQYRFFSDLEEKNKMDERPFLEFSLQDPQEMLIQELKKLSKPVFDIDRLLSAAHELKYTKALKAYLAAQWSAPEEDFVKFLTKRVYEGPFTQSVREQFAGIVRAILRETVDIARVAHRDKKTYFGVLLDDNNRKPICRLHFNTRQKYISIFDVDEGERLPIDSLDEIYTHADRLKVAAARYDA